MRETVEWITALERFEQLSARWDRLAERERTPFALHAWMSAWWDAFAAGRRLQICALWREDELVGVFPACAGRGRWEAMANGETEAFRPLARDGPALVRLVETVVEAAPSQLILPALSPQEPALGALESASSYAGRWTVVEPQSPSVIADTGGELAEYVSRINKERWAAVQRRRRKLEREHQPTFRCVEEPYDSARQLQQYLEIEASGWKGRRGTAILCSPAMERFYRSIARSFEVAGALRFSEIAIKERPIAFELQLQHAGRLFVLKRGYDERYRRLGPGMVLQGAVIVRCFELGLEAYEFLGEDEPHKRRFATSERTHCTLRSYQRRPVSGARYLYRRRVRPVLKRVYRYGLRRFGKRP